VVNFYPQAFSVRTRTPHLDDHILEAAARLFGTKRFHEVRMDDIARQAEVSKGTLYRYFEDKEQLYLALLERATRQLLTRVESDVASAHGGRRRLVAMVAAILDYFDAHPHLFDLIQRAEVRSQAGAAFPWQVFRDESLRLVQRVFEGARRQGELDVGDPHLAALMLFGGLQAVIRFGAMPRPENLAEQIVDTFLHGADRNGLQGPV
jgi:TetR/AcrR family fatty acid metabolism transcriptional regulator